MPSSSVLFGKRGASVSHFKSAPAVWQPFRSREFRKVRGNEAAQPSGARRPGRIAATAGPLTGPGSLDARPARLCVLIASTAWWAFPVQIALGFSRLGISVQAVCPTGHALRKARVVERTYAYRGLSPLQSLGNAIKAARPSLIVACDDRSVEHLHALHASCLAIDPDMAALIERSLGSPCGFEAVQRRSVVIAAANEIGVAAPRMVGIGGLRDLRLTLWEFGLPAVVKLDGTWGGLGVSVVHTQAEAAATYRAMRQRHSLLVALKRLFVDRDTFSLFTWLRHAKPVVNLQQFAPGRPANCAVACWQGEVLACSCVEVVRAQNACGASTIVRRIDNPAMLQMVRAMARELGLSGLCGFDFLIDDASGQVHLLECNPRATPLSHIDLGPGADPLAALAARAFGQVREQPAQNAGSPNTLPDIIAFFPQCWSLEPDSPLLHTCQHDVPWAEPEVVRELVQPPWPERGLLARLLNHRRNKTPLPIWRIPEHL
jgi:hypothetical protein